LYELLTLEPAFSGQDTQELLQRIAFEEPRLPRRVNRAVPQDMETIVLKAIAKHPDERYATAQELADELGRYLKDEPIRARRPTLLQRVRKWSRRHRAAVWSAGLLAAVMVVLMAATWLWVTLERSAIRSAAIRSADQAVLEATEHLQGGRWLEAQLAVERAQAHLAGFAGRGPISPRLQSRIDQAVADLKMAERLEEIRVQQSQVRDEYFNAKQADSAYAAAFREIGIESELIDIPQAARRIAASPIRLELCAALDDWARIRRFSKADAPNWQSLIAVAKAADPDPQRTALRDALKKEAPQALTESAATEQVTDLPPSTLILLAVVLRQMDRGDDALKLLRKAQRRYPNDFWINHDLALLLREPPNSAPDEAIRFYTAALALRPDSPGVYVNLGNAFLDLQMVDEAIEAYQSAIHLKPDYAMAWNNLGSAFEDQGQLEKALDAYRQATWLRPNFAMAHHNLGFILLSQGHLNGAIAAFQNAIRDDPEYAEAHYNLGIALERNGQLDAAATEYREALRVRPNYAQAHCNLGWYLTRNGKIDDAIVHLRQALRINPDLAVAHLNLGIALEQRGDTENAISEFRQAIRLDPDNALSYFNLGNAEHRRGELEAAIAAFNESIRRAPDLAEAHCNLGHALRAKGDLTRALAAFQRGHELGRTRSDWNYPSEQWIEECTQLIESQDRPTTIGDQPPR
jgi:serine/threonine-protein kinase